MDPLTWMLIGSAIGAGSGLLQYPEQKKQADEQRRINAEAMRYSPWTGMKPDQLYTPEPSLMGNIVQGGLTGASFGGLLGSKFGETTPSTTPTTTKTDNSSVGGAGMSTNSAQVQIPTDDSSLYDRSLQSSYARGQGGPLHNPWMYMNSAPMYQGQVRPPYAVQPPRISY